MRPQIYIMIIAIIIAIIVAIISIIIALADTFHYRGGDLTPNLFKNIRRGRVEEAAIAHLISVATGSPFISTCPHWLQEPLLDGTIVPHELDGYSMKLSAAFEYQGPIHYSTQPNTEADAKILSQRGKIREALDNYLRNKESKTLSWQILSYYYGEMQKQTTNEMIQNRRQADAFKIVACGRAAVELAVIECYVQPVRCFAQYILGKVLKFSKLDMNHKRRIENILSGFAKVQINPGIYGGSTTDLFEAEMKNLGNISNFEKAYYARVQGLRQMSFAAAGHPFSVGVLASQVLAMSELFEPLPPVFETDDTNCANKKSRAAHAKQLLFNIENKCFDKEICDGFDFLTAEKQKEIFARLNSTNDKYAKDFLQEIIKSRIPKSILPQDILQSVARPPILPISAQTYPAQPNFASIPTYPPQPYYGYTPLFTPPQIVSQPVAQIPVSFTTAQSNFATIRMYPQLQQPFYGYPPLFAQSQFLRR